MEVETKGYDLKVSLDNFLVSYNDIGEGNIPIIFLHGFPFDKTMWQGQLDYLKCSYLLISCDIRGFGKSTDEHSHLSIDMFADDLVQFMDMLNINKAIVCGLSMGGYIVLNALKRFPERFEAIILCDTQCIADSDEVSDKRYKTIDEITKDGVTKFNEGFIKKVICKNSFNNKKELVKNLYNVVFSNSQHIITSGLNVFAERSETCSTLDEINIPTLIICGKEDEVTPVGQSEFMNSKIRDSTIHIINNAGHVSNLEQPDEFNKHLLNFLETVGEFNFKKINGNQRMS